MTQHRRQSGIRLVRDGVSVYEVEVDLGRYAGISTSQLDGFAARLVRVFPGLRKHECYAGEAGGFVKEMKSGTDLAHVMEHLILEMLKVACAPLGRFAATNALELIDTVLHGKSVDKQGMLRCIRGSREVRR